MKKNKKGFTLAELLIVVAIIAVLVAIAIPVFTSQLEKSRDSVTVSNLRAAYAEAQTAYLTGDDGGNATYVSTTEVDVSGVVSKGQNGDLSGLEADLPFDIASSDLNTLGGTPSTYEIAFTYTLAADGSITSIEASIK